MDDSLHTRRHFLRGMTLGAAGLSIVGLYSVPGLFAQELTLTPRSGEGPFYPDYMPLDTDNDLLIVNDGITPAVGEITHLSGAILDAKGDPIRNDLPPRTSPPSKLDSEPFEVHSTG